MQDAINAAYAGDNGNVGDGGDSAVRLFCFDVKMHIRLEMHEHFLKKLRMNQEGAMMSKRVVPLWQRCQYSQRISHVRGVCRRPSWL